MKAFTLSISGDVTLTVEEIWPDGDAPKEPTSADVIAKLRRNPMWWVMREWDLGERFDFEVSHG